MTVSREIAVIGSGGHAVSVLDAAISAGFQPVAIVDPLTTLPEVFGLPVIPDVSSLHLGAVALCLGIGKNHLRQRVFEDIRGVFPDCRFPSIVHRTAWVSPLAQVGEGTVILSQASVGPHAKTMTGALINTGASLDHDSSLGEFASLAPGGRTGGNVSIGARSMVGLNAAIMQGVSVGHDSVIGAQSLVRDDIASLTIAFGVPCTPRRTRQRDDE